MLAPALRERYDLSLSQIGVVLAAGWIGTTVTLLPWGFLADRIGERAVLAMGLGGCAAATAGAAYAPGFLSLCALLALAGGAGAGVNSATGRAVMTWFLPAERGLALGVRQTAVPLGGLVAAICLPLFPDVRTALLFLAGLCLLGALAGLTVLRRTDDGVDPEGVPLTLRDRRLWRLCVGSGLYVIAQVAIMSFTVLYLHDERGFSLGAAAAVVAVAQVLAGAARIGAGRWSDVLGARVVPLRQIGLA
nr:MFS transporter [Actinomycetota bacterium]